MLGQRIVQCQLSELEIRAYVNTFWEEAAQGLCKAGAGEFRSTIVDAANHVTSVYEARLRSFLDFAKEEASKAEVAQAMAEKKDNPTQ